MGGRRFQGRWGLGLNKRERGGRGGRATPFVRGNYKSFKGTNLTVVVEGMHRFIMYIL